MAQAPASAVAVLTGDIVGSTRLSWDDRAKLRTILTKKLPAELDEQFPDLLHSGIDVFRGDSLQLLLSEAKLALRVSLYLRAALKAHLALSSIDVRLAIGLGEAQLAPRRRVSSGDGEAFRLSGPALDAMPGSRSLVIATRSEKLTRSLDVVLHLIDAVVRKWSDRQGIAVLGKLRGLAQVEIAKLPMWNPGTGEGIKQPSVARHLQAAGWDAVEHGLHYFEQQDFRLDSEI